MNEIIRRQATEYSEMTRSFRRDFHKHPELGYQELRTSGIVAAELARLGLEVRTGVAETGVVGVLNGKKPGPVILIRFDMDALPVTEENEIEYRSVHAGIMHACGHDGHMAVGLTTARILAELREIFYGTVKFVFQPAEEGLHGAERMVREGILEDPAPDVCLAFHIWNEKPVGWVGIVPGPLMAGADIFHLKIMGKGGHGAMPDQTIDPILATAQVVTALQSVISRNLPPVEGGVISVTTIHGGEAFNVIPPSVTCSGTIRWFVPEIRERIVQKMVQVAKGVGEGMGCQVDLEVTTITPAVQNDPILAQKLIQMVQQAFPDIKLETNYRSMVSEDMAYIMEKIPGVYLLVGGMNEQLGLTYGHHHPRFNFDESALPIAVSLLVSGVLKLLSNN